MGAGAGRRLVSWSVDWSAGRVRLFTLQKAFECSANNIGQQQQQHRQQHSASTAATATTTITITAAREQRTDWPCNTGRAARISCDLDEACLMLSTPSTANTQTTLYDTPSLPSLVQGILAKLMLVLSIQFNCFAFLRKCPAITAQLVCLSLVYLFACL